MQYCIEFHSLDLLYTPCRMDLCLRLDRATTILQRREEVAKDTRKHRGHALLVPNNDN